MSCINKKMPQILAAAAVMAAFSAVPAFAASGWQMEGDQWVYLDRYGDKVTDTWKKSENGFWFYLDEDGYMAVNRLVENGDDYYYVNEDGARVKNEWRKLEDDSDDEAYTDGTCWYYFGNDGKAEKNDSGRARLTTINGKKYYLDKKDNGAMKTGWVTVKGKKYYMSKSGSKKGQAVTGWMTSGKSRYYFNSSGVMQKGWLTLGNKKYYLNPSNGKMVTGKKTISGKTYDFGKKGYLTTTPTGAWSIKVNQGTNVVTVYRGSTPVKAMLCSVGLNGATPNGTRYITDKLRWHELMGPSWGQYCEHLSTSPNSVWSSYLFHSVPYNRYRDPRSMSASAYNMLGQAASHGCIRLNVESAKYIYDNVPIGTKVTIFRGTSANDPLGKPSLKKIPSWQTWDPTDPNI